MANIIFKQPLSQADIIQQMREDTAFDVSDDDSACVPDFSAIKNEIRAKPNPPKVPKVMLSNNCIFNCAYCGCRESNELRTRYTQNPKELAELCVKEAINNKHGVFITSAICKNPDYTEELIIETIKHMRVDLMYKGYIHAKVMPGTDAELIRRAGLYASRLSVNIEVAKSEGYNMVAKNKNRQNILTPMGQISQSIMAAKSERSRYAPPFAKSQTTQLMAGSTKESDYEILRLSGAMYKKYNLQRVYYTNFQYPNPVKGYDLETVKTPFWRVTRLYQADRLMQIYGFSAEDIAPEIEPNLSHDIDPKAAWALRHIHLYPIEVNTADYEMLLRIPGIGTTYAARIIKARKYCKITHDVLRMLGVALKRSKHFMTCNGVFTGERCEDLGLYRSLVATPLPTSDGENHCFQI